MKISERTRKYKWGRLLFILDWVLCFGTALAFIITCASGAQGDESLKEKLGTIVYGFGAGLIPMVVLAIIVKDKIRPTVWMIDIVLANYLYGSIGMYIVLGVWFIGEYIIMPLSKRFSTLYLVNREIDARG